VKLAGAYGLELRNNGTSESMYSNNITATSGPCPAVAFRITDSENYNNVSHNNTYTAKSRPASPRTVVCFTASPQTALGQSQWILQPLLRHYNLPVTTTLSSQIRPSCIFDYDIGTNEALFTSPTFTKGSNPDPDFFHFAVFFNAGTVNVHVRDATFGTGVSPTDTVLPAQGSNESAASLYIDWTLTLTVQNSSGTPISGASVTYTDTASTQECNTTTSSTGTAICILTQYRLNNDTGANQIENRNPFRFTLSAPGCTTSTGQESVTAPISETKQLSGC